MSNVTSQESSTAQRCMEATCESSEMFVLISARPARGSSPSQMRFRNKGRESDNLGKAYQIRPGREAARLSKPTAHDDVLKWRVRSHNFRDSK